jgi:hypothetical protein
MFLGVDAMDDEFYPFKDYPYNSKSTLYICYGCKRAISIRTKKIYFRKFVHINTLTGEWAYYREPFCEKCYDNPDSWWQNY